MTPAKADELGLQITQTWKNVPPLPIWVEELAPLHHEQAKAAYVKLRRESENAPSIARFLNMYHSLPKSDRDEPYQWKPATRGEGPPMSYSEYMDTLIIKAGNGDREANEMLDIWADNENRNLSIAKFIR